jgi:hypothetical protein
MSRISIELVPRDSALLHQQLTLIKEHYPCVNTINIPDPIFAPWTFPIVSPSNYWTIVVCMA